MKILSIKLKNIHSLKGRHEINFLEGPLAKTGLFAIIGPTGSGKSTLLDAITLALFKCTPRSGNLSKSSIEKTGAIITRNTLEAFCEVDYESNGKTFRSRWEISRARTGNLREQHMSLSWMNELGAFTVFDIKPGEVPAKNAEIIGLNYDQFIKSILLSQGEFAKFLKSDAKDRSALLEKITGTEIYTRIGIMAFEKQKQEKAILERLQMQLGDIELLDEEDRKNLLAQIKELADKINREKTEADVLAKKIATKTQLEHNALELSKKTEALNRLLQKSKDYKSDEERLALHNKILPHKSNLDQVLNSEKQLGRMEKEKTGAEQNVSILKSEIEALEQQIKTHDEVLQKHQDSYKQLLPVLETVKTTDEKIKIENTKYEQSQKQHAGIFTEIFNESEILTAQISEQQNIADKLKRIATFLDDNPELAYLSADLPGIERQNKSIDTQKNSLIQKIKTSLFATRQDGDLPNSSRQILEMVEAEFKDVHLQMKSLKNEIGEKPVDQQQIIVDIDLLSKKSKDLSEMLRLSQHHQKMEEEKNTLLQRRDAVKKSLSEIEQSGEKLAQQRQITEKYLEELQARKEREALEAKYDDQRKKLEPETACPLCGSKQHPFVDNYQNTLNQTEELLKNQNSAFRQISKQLEDLRITLAKLETEIESNKNEYHKIISDLEQTLEAFENLSKKNGITTQITNSTAILAEHTQAESSIKKLKHHLDLVLKISKLKEAENALTLLVDEGSKLIGLEDELHQMLQPYSKYILHKTHIDKIIKILNLKLTHHKEALKQQTEFNEKAAITKSGIAAKQTRIKQLKQEQESLKEELDNLSANCRKLKEERTQLFGEKNPDTEDKNLTALIKTTEKNISECEKNLEIGKTKKSNFGREIKKLAQTIHEARTEINHLSTKLQPLLNQLKMQLPQDALNAMLTEEEAKGIQNKLSQLKAETDKTQQSLEDLNNAIAKLNAEDDKTVALPELERLKKELDETISAAHQETGTLKARLDQDAKNQQKFASLGEKINAQEKEYLRWEALNNLIGDARGAKFSKFAQQLTLIQLLTKANQHLQKLTDRYIVINENMGDNDELFVIDTYHGDEKRSVKTLSGGESFLVSLALALGLSDLAGNKTRIGSLFIDEGFGSLDQETLDTALSTLEKLQHETNRTIGIISHVEALKERITTQIELTKDAMGSSMLRIKS